MFAEEGKEVKVSSLELLLMKRLEKAFEAIDAGAGELFDDITDEMEMLLKLKPDIYNQLMHYKEELVKNISILAEQASNFASSARNEIQRKNFYDGEIDSIEWDARKDYIDFIITLMGVNQMLPMETSEPATLENVNDKISEEEMKQETEEMINEGETKLTKPDKKKPKLSIDTKKKGNEFEL